MVTHTRGTDRHGRRWALTKWIRNDKQMACQWWRDDDVKCRVLVSGTYARLKHGQIVAKRQGPAMRLG